MPEPEHPVKVSLIGANFMDEFKVVDISRGGVGILAPHAFEGCNLNEQVDLALSLPFPKRTLLKARGEIVHHHGLRFGIAFSDLPQKSKQLIQSYIAKRILKEPVGRRIAFYLGWI